MDNAAMSERSNALDESMRVGSISVANRLLLAPLAGITDWPFRLLCQEMGAGLTFVQMISANAVNHGNRRTQGMLFRHPAERLVGVQIVGSDSLGVCRAIEAVGDFPLVDINMGCPARKILGAASGSALLREPARVSEILREARRATSAVLSVKIRLGYSAVEVNVEEICRRIADEGVDMCTIHGRTREQDYGVPVNLVQMANGVGILKNSGVVAVGNGNVFHHADAVRVRLVSECDAVMMARGSLGNPWLFSHLLKGDSLAVSVEEWLRVVERHLLLQEEAYGDTEGAAVQMRKHLLWYVAGFPRARAARDGLTRAASISEARARVRAFAESVGKDCLRTPPTNGSGYCESAIRSNFSQ